VYQYQLKWFIYNLFLLPNVGCKAGSMKNNSKNRSYNLGKLFFQKIIYSEKMILAKKIIFLAFAKPYFLEKINIWWRKSY